MEEIENLINKVKGNDWGENETIISLIKKMLNFNKCYWYTKSKPNDGIYEKDEENNESIKKSYEEDRRLIEIYDKGIEFLKDNINNLIRFVGTINKYYEIFPLIRDERSVVFLFEKLLSEENRSAVEKIKDVLITPIEEDENYILWFEPFIPGLTPFIEEMSHKISGRNSNYFWNVIEEISNENIEIKTNLYKNRRKILCGIKSAGECIEFIPPEKNEYFIAYPFSDKKIKDVIIDSFKKRWQRIYGDENKLTPITADDRMESEGVLCRICKEIHYTKFGVYVLSKERKTNFPNPNVMLELGIAMKIGKPYILIYKKGTRNIADLAGYIRLEYNIYGELKNRIISLENLENYLQVEV